MNLVIRCINRFAGVVVRVSTNEPLVALTFDDGPDPYATPALMELLATHGAKATFFMTGANAAKYPQLAAAVHSAGHAIGNHTWDHPSLPLVTRRERLDQLRRTARVLPVDGPWFRPPYGHLDFRTHRDLWMSGRQIIAWSTIIPDWQGRPAAELVEMARHAIGPGSIISMHDALADFADASCIDRRPTVEAVGMLLAEMAGRFEFVTVPELIRRGKPVRTCWRLKPDVALLNQLNRVDGPARRYGMQPHAIGTTH